MGSNDIVRSARSDDVAAIQQIARETWTFTYQEIMPSSVRDQALRSWYSDEALSAHFESPAGTFLVAEDATGRCAGFAQFVRRDEVMGELTRIYVLPSHHGLGLGSQLLRAGLDWMRAQRLTTLTVAVEEENPGGRRFYERSGFSVARTHTEDVFGHALSLIVYERPVP